MWQERLREIRESQGLTQEAVAFRAGLAVATYRRLETGKKAYPTLLTLERVADVLGVEVRDIV